MNEGPAAGRPIVQTQRLDGRTGPLWGVACEDLNATVLAWQEGGGTAEHTNATADVLLVVLGGQGRIRLDGHDHAIATGDVVLIEKGRARQVSAGAGGLRYLTVHRRRGGLSIARAGDTEPAEPVP